jgi:hypothetical protein
MRDVTAAASTVVYLRVLRNYCRALRRTRYLYLGRTSASYKSRLGRKAGPRAAQSSPIHHIFLARQRPE